jgi:Yip1 domain
VDVNKIIARAKGILLTPRTEWPIIAAEPDTVAGLYTGYIVLMAAVPAIIRFISMSLIGTSVLFLGSYRMPITTGLTWAVLSYVLSLVGVFISALVVDALAPSFGAQKSQVQALKSVAYAYTAVWVASIIGIVPGLGIIATLAGLIYSIFLLNMGLPFTMKCPPEKSIGYTVVSIIVAIVISFIINWIVSMVGFGTMGMGRGFGAFSNASPSIAQPSGGFAAGSTGAALQAYADKMDKASKQMDAASKSGDSNAQANAMGAMLGAALGSGGKVESLPPDRIKPFIPDTLGGLKRTQMSVQKNGALGMQVSTGTATYSDGAQHTLTLEVTDTGSMKGLMGFAAGWAGVEQDNETDTGYDKIYKSGGQLVHEKWDNKTQYGEYGAVVADRFSVKVSGTAANIDELKAAVGSIDLSGLAALKNEGVQNN